MAYVDDTVIPPDPPCPIIWCDQRIGHYGEHDSMDEWLKRETES